MSTPEAPTAKPRRRFQFSLRTLFVGVLLYCALWLVTLKWGGRVLAARYAAAYSKDQPTINDDGSLTLRHQPNDNPRNFTRTYRGFAVSPAPFVLRWEWRICADEKAGVFSDRLGAGNYHVCLPGYRREVGKQEPPYVDPPDTPIRKQLVQVWYTMPKGGIRVGDTVSAPSVTPVSHGSVTPSEFETMKKEMEEMRKEMRGMQAQ